MTSITKNLNIISINVNSIVSIMKRSYLQKFLKLHNPDIIFLSETKLTAKHKLEFYSYNIIRNDRPKASFGGGTAILIKKGIAYRQISSPQINSFKCIETTNIMLPIEDKNLLVLSSIYAPRCEGSLFQKEIEELFVSLQFDSPSRYYIIAGDLNAKHADWQNPVNNTRGNFLTKWLKVNEITYKSKLYGPTSPTLPSADSYLDLCIADTRLAVSSNQKDKVNVLPFDSDHNAIQFTVAYNTESPFQFTKDIVSQIPNYRKANWNKFQKHLTSKLEQEIPKHTFIRPDRNLTNTEIDQTIDILNQLIEQTINKSIPYIKPRDNIKCYTTKQIELLEKHKSTILSKIFRLYRSGHTKESPELIRYKSIMNCLKILIKRNYHDSINSYWKEKITGISKRDTKGMFPQINTIFRPKSKVTLPDIVVHESEIGGLDIDPINAKRDSLGNVTITEEECKLNVLGLNFEKIHSTDANLGRERLTRIVQDKVNKLLDGNRSTTLLNFNSNVRANELDENTTKNYFTTKENFVYIFRSLNNKKSSGIDRIPNIVLKHLPISIINIYCIVINNALNNAYFSNIWKKALVIPLHKKGKNPNDAKSYRPISLLPNISKVFEVIVKQAIDAIILEKDIIPNCQFGFRHRHSTIHAIGKLTSDICWQRNSGKCVGACLVDMEKAFDTVWRDGLLYKLIKKGFPEHLIVMIHNMIGGKKFIVKNGQTSKSKEYKVENGLQQGTVLAPTLYNIYTSDLLTAYNFNLDKNVIAFADDIVIYTAGSSIQEIQTALQKNLDDILFYTKSWKMKVNVNKCETILFRPPLSKANRNIKNNWKKFKLKVGTQDIPNKTEVKYLGILLDQYSYYTKHIQVQLEKAKKAFMLLKRMFYNKHLDPQVKIVCYETLIRPILTYACPIWYNISASYMEKFRIFERKALRTCLGKYRTQASGYVKRISNRAIYNMANIERIDIHILRLARKHFLRTRNIMDNDNISQIIYPNDLYFKRTLTTGYIPPEAFGYLDKEGYIQDRNGLPIIYHMKRRPTDKRITYNSNVDVRQTQRDIRFKYTIGTTYKRKKKFRVQAAPPWWCDT